MSSGINVALHNEVSENAEVVASRELANEKLEPDSVEPETEDACNLVSNSDEKPACDNRNTRSSSSTQDGEREGSDWSLLDTCSTVCKSQNSPLEQDLQRNCSDYTATVPSSELCKTANEDANVVNTLNDVDRTKSETTVKFLTSAATDSSRASEISNREARSTTEGNATVKPWSSQVDNAIDNKLVAFQASVNVAKTGRSTGEVSVVSEGANVSLTEPVFNEFPVSVGAVNEALRYETGLKEIAVTNGKDGKSPASDITAPSDTPSVTRAIKPSDILPTVITAVLPVTEDRAGSNLKVVRCADPVATSKETSCNATSSANVPGKAEASPCSVSDSSVSCSTRVLIEDDVRTPNHGQSDREHAEFTAEEKRAPQLEDERGCLGTTDVPVFKDTVGEVQRFYVDSTTVSSTAESLDAATKGVSREDRQAEELRNVVPKSPKRVVLKQITPTSNIPKPADDSNGPSRDRAPCPATRSLLNAMKAVQEEADDSQSTDQELKENGDEEPVETGGSSSTDASKTLSPCENTKILLDTVKTALQENVEKLSKFAQATEETSKPPAPKSPPPEDYGNLEGLVMVDDCACDFVCDVAAVCIH